MRKILFATLALAPMLLVGGQPQKQLNVFELPVSKLPSEKFIIEAAFSKDVETNCNGAFLLGGKLEEMDTDRGFYYEFSGKGELAQTLMLCNEEKKKRKIYYELKQALPYVSPVKIMAPSDVKVELRVFRFEKTIKPKIERPK